ncbi:MAG: 4-hydroxy-tetrahydrodipicolinate reductase [Holosporaceae bacterium]|jgi:4-hydroxy-tetrahydrodipicolinate reductase|nr:4-hydroxy-tetrahydrodipicolinate reductase [Holosporaceae bacterium]
MKIGIVGITGRIGSLLLKIIPDAEKNGGISSITSSEKLIEVVGSSDVLIDFSTPSCTLNVMAVASTSKVPIISGTTGFSEKDFKRVREFSQIIPLLHSSNFSVCIHLMAIFIDRCANILSDFDFSIIEKHHRRKKDSPSGTALFLAKQTSKNAQIVSLREGNIFGEHTCDFAGENEILSMTHHVFNPEVFATGALACARWIMGKPPGLYSMRDYLESSKEGKNY